MTIEQVLVFHKIYELGSFKAAAQELHKTQPAISFSMKKLEEELGVELFDRSAYRLVLTAHGKLFVEKSSKLLQEMGQLELLAKSFRQEEEPELNVSLDGISLSSDLLRFFKTFGDGTPHTRLHLSFDILSEAEKKVRTGESQIGVTHFLTETRELEVIPVGEVRMLPVIDTQLFRERDVKSQDDLRFIDQIVVGDKQGTSGPSFGLLEQGKRWRIMDSNFKRELIFAGLGWGHLPEPSVRRELAEGRLKILEFADVKPRSLEFKLIRSRLRAPGPVSRRLWDKLLAFHQKSC